MKTIRELGGEIWSELYNHFDEEQIRWELKNEVSELVMAVLARYDGEVIENDRDLPVDPLPKWERQPSE